MNSAQPTGRSTVPNYRAHKDEQIQDDNFKSIGDYASSGNYGSGGNSDEPIDRRSLFDTGQYMRPFGQSLTSAERQRGRQNMRKIMQEHFGREY